MGKMEHLIIALCLCGLSLPCAAQGKSDFAPFEMATVYDDGSFAIKDPQDAIVVLYTPGSARNDVASPCRWMASAPPIILHLAGTRIAGKDVLVHGYCSTAVGRLPDRSMAEVRAPELERIVREYLKQGVPPNQVIVAGHSMGGWAALLVGARGNVDIAGFIAFAPGNGVWTKDRRGPRHAGAVLRQRTAVDGLDQLNGLVFAFFGDPFNEPVDLEHLGEIPGIVFIASEPCAHNAHMTALYDCFWQQYEDEVRAFIEDRVVDTGN